MQKLFEIVNQPEQKLLENSKDRKSIDQAIIQLKQMIQQLNQHLNEIHDFEPFNAESYLSNQQQILSQFHQQILTCIDNYFISLQKQVQFQIQQLSQSLPSKPELLQKISSHQTQLELLLSSTKSNSIQGSQKLIQANYNQIMTQIEEEIKLYYQQHQSPQIELSMKSDYSEQLSIAFESIISLNKPQVNQQNNKSIMHIQQTFQPILCYITNEINLFIPELPTPRKEVIPLPSQSLELATIISALDSVFFIRGNPPLHLEFSIEKGWKSRQFSPIALNQHQGVWVEKEIFINGGYNVTQNKEKKIFSEIPCQITQKYDISNNK